MAHLGWRFWVLCWMKKNEELAQVRLKLSKAGVVRALAEPCPICLRFLCSFTYIPSSDVCNRQQQSQFTTFRAAIHYILNRCQDILRASANAPKRLWSCCRTSFLRPSPAPNARPPALPICFNIGLLLIGSAV